MWHVSTKAKQPGWFVPADANPKKRGSWAEGWKGGEVVQPPQTPHGSGGGGGGEEQWPDPLRVLRFAQESEAESKGAHRDNAETRNDTSRLDDMLAGRSHRP